MDPVTGAGGWTLLIGTVIGFLVGWCLIFKHEPKKPYKGAKAKWMPWLKFVACLMLAEVGYAVALYLAPVFIQLDHKTDKYASAGAIIGFILGLGYFVTDDFAHLNPYRKGIAALMVAAVGWAIGHYYGPTIIKILGIHF